MKDLEFEIFNGECQTLLEISNVFIKHMYNAIDECGYGVALDDENKIILYKKEGEERITFDTFIEMFPVIFDDQLKSAIEESLKTQGKKPMSFERLSTRKVKEAKTIIKTKVTEEEFESLEKFVEKVSNKKNMC